MTSPNMPIRRVARLSPDETEPARQGHDLAETSAADRLLVIAGSLQEQLLRDPEPARILKLTELYLQILQQHPQTVGAFIGLARIEYQWGSCEQAAMLLNTALALEPDYPGLAQLRAQVLSTCVNERRKQVIEQHAAQALAQSQPGHGPIASGLLGRLREKQAGGLYKDLGDLASQSRAQAGKTPRRSSP